MLFFSLDFGLTTWLIHISLVMTLITVNREHYRSMLNNFFWSELNVVESTTCGFNRTALPAATAYVT